MGKATDKLSNNMKVTLKIEGMTCASCVGRVETALKKVDGVQSASVNLATERADIVLDQPVDRQVLVHAIEQSGYDVPANNIELSIAVIKSSTFAEPLTVARSVARLTLASFTPATALRAFSTRPTQLAQVMPLIDNSILFAGTS